MLYICVYQIINCMSTLLIEITNPKANRILQELEDLEIIKVLERNGAKKRVVKKATLNMEAVRNYLSSIKGSLSSSVIEEREERI